MNDQHESIHPIQLLAVVVTAVVAVWIGAVLTDLINETPQNAVYIFAAPGVLGIVLAVAIASYAFKNRTMFVLGALGAISGPLFGRMRSTGGYIDEALGTAEIWGITGMIAAIILCSFAYSIQGWNQKLQFSLSSLLLITILVACALAIWRNTTQ